MNTLSGKILELQPADR